MSLYWCIILVSEINHFSNLSLILYWCDLSFFNSFAVLYSFFDLNQCPKKFSPSLLLLLKLHMYVKCDSSGFEHTSPIILTYLLLFAFHRPSLFSLLISELKIFSQYLFSCCWVNYSLLLITLRRESKIKQFLLKL